MAHHIIQSAIAIIPSVTHFALQPALPQTQTQWPWLRHRRQHSRATALRYRQNSFEIIYCFGVFGANLAIFVQ